MGWRLVLRGEMARGGRPRGLPLRETDASPVNRPRPRAGACSRLGSCTAAILLACLCSTGTVCAAATWPKRVPARGWGRDPELRISLYENGERGQARGWVRAASRSAAVWRGAEQAKAWQT